MKRRIPKVTASLVAASLVLAVGLSSAQAAVRYFDVNDTGADSGVTDGSIYPWDTAALSWSQNSDGSGTAVAWANGDDAVFSAGTDAANLLYALNIASGVTANSAAIEEGVVRVLSGVWNTGAGTTTISPNAAIRTAASLQFAGDGKIVLSGTSLTDGAEIQARNSASAGSMLNAGATVYKTIEINGFGKISYDDGDGINDNKVSIVVKNVITGTGGSPATGGAGTLVISGPDQVGFSVFDLGGTDNGNYKLNSFAKLVVNGGGSFRLRSGTVAGGAAIDERMFGAVPLASLPDAITLDNGSAIGTNSTVTLNAFRGITIGPNGGRASGIGLGVLVVPGPLTSAGGSTSVLKIDGRNLTLTSATYGNSGGGLTLSNANNTSTFVNTALLVNSSVLTLNESLNASQLDGVSEFASGGTSAAGNASATATGTITIASGKTLTVGSNNNSSSYAGRVTGAGGIFTKVGSGELLLNTVPASTTSVASVFAVVYSGEWSNTGGVNINAGSIKFGNTNSGFATTAPVTIGATGKLNMNGINDQFGSLAGPIGGIVDMNDSGAAATIGNLTLGATTGTTTYSGTITGGGNFTKAGVASTATQILGGNTSLGVVTVSNGSLLNNAAMTTTGGVTVAAAATLGGTGSITGNIGNSGIIAPGASVGTLSVTGNVTNLAGSSWSIELSGSAADKLAVTGNIDLTAADSLNVTGTGSGTSWIIGTYTGTESGVFDSITSGYSVTYSGGNITLNAAASCSPGDLNCDGHVDAADYVFWRKTSGPPANYTAWRSNFGVPPGAGTAGGLGGGTVPEPTTICLVLSGLVFVAAGRRRGR